MTVVKTSSPYQQTAGRKMNPGAAETVRQEAPAGRQRDPADPDPAEPEPAEPDPADTDPAEPSRHQLTSCSRSLQGTFWWESAPPGWKRIGNELGFWVSLLRSGRHRGVDHSTCRDVTGLPQ